MEFYEQFSTKVLLTRRVLSIYGIKEEYNFYNNLEFDGAQVEENNAKEFIAKWATTGLLFLDDECLAVPNTSDSKDESSDIPEEIPLTAYFGNAFNYKDKNKPLPNASASSVVSKITPSLIPSPFTPEGECEHEDFHDHAIPLNQMAQKIPRLLDLELPESSSGNIYL